jgi:hypothetical protein
MKKKLFLALALSTMPAAAVFAQPSSDSSTSNSSTSNDMPVGSGPSGSSGSSSSGDSIKSDTTGRGAGASGAVSNPQESQVESQFNRLDTKHQGYLTESDASKDKNLSKNFSQVDNDKDGKITLFEYKVYEEISMGGGSTGGASESEVGKKDVQN